MKWLAPFAGLALIGHCVVHGWGQALTGRAPMWTAPVLTIFGALAATALTGLILENVRCRSLGREVTRRSKRSRVFRKAMHHE